MLCCHVPKHLRLLSYADMWDLDGSSDTIHILITLYLKSLLFNFDTLDLDFSVSPSQAYGYTKLRFWYFNIYILKSCYKTKLSEFLHAPQHNALATKSPIKSINQKNDYLQQESRSSQQGLACPNCAQLVLPAFKPPGHIRAGRKKNLCDGIPLRWSMLR